MNSSKSAHSPLKQGAKSRFAALGDPARIGSEPLLVAGSAARTPLCGLSANSQVPKLAAPLIIQLRQTASIIVELTDSQLLISKQKAGYYHTEISKFGRLKCSLAAFSLQF